MKDVKLKPIVLGGIPMEGYFIEYINKEIRVWSKKFGKMKRLSIPKSGKSSYPGFNFSIDGILTKADIHRVIAENIVPFPKPESMTHKDWKATPESAKNIMKSVFFVNHIDHNKYNCHPSNLEWVTPKGNVHAFHKHKRKSI